MLTQYTDVNMESEILIELEFLSGKRIYEGCDELEEALYCPRD